MFDSCQFFLPLDYLNLLTHFKDLADRYLRIKNYLFLDYMKKRRSLGYEIHCLEKYSLQIVREKLQKLLPWINCKYVPSECELYFLKYNRYVKCAVIFSVSYIF